MPSTRPPPQVVVFKDPTAGHRARSGPPQARKAAADATSPRTAATRSIAVTAAMLAEVEAFATSSLEGKARKKHELQQRVALGAIPPKRNKIPLPILQGMHRKRQFETKMTRIRQQEQGTYVKPKSDKERAKGTPAAGPAFTPGDSFRNGAALVDVKKSNAEIRKLLPSFGGARGGRGGRGGGRGGRGGRGGARGGRGGRGGGRGGGARGNGARGGGARAGKRGAGRK